MSSYGNLGGDSGVVAYDIKADAIDVTFRDGMHYRYTDRSAGPENIKQMKRLAEAGEGLNSYITRVVKKGYESKWR